MTQTAAPIRPLLTTAQVAERLAVSNQTVRNLVFSAGLPALRFGRILRFDPEALDLWLDAQTQTPTPAAQVLALPFRPVGGPTR